MEIINQTRLRYKPLQKCRGFLLDYVIYFLAQFIDLLRKEF